MKKEGYRPATIEGAVRYLKRVAKHNDIMNPEEVIIEMAWFPGQESSPFRWILFVVGLLILLYGVIAIIVSGNIVPGLLSSLSLVKLDTPFGSIQTDDRQYGAGIILAFIGLLVMWVSSRM